MRRLPLLILIPAFAAALTITPAHADFGGLSAAPATSDPGNPATRAYFILNATPGQTITDQVKVSNSGAGPKDLLVSAVDGVTGATSGAVYANRQDPVTKAGTWLATAVSSLTVPAGASKMVDFTVRIPANAAPGDHLAGVALEDAHPSSNGSNFQVTTVLRAVVGVLVHVSGPAAFHTFLGSASIVPFTDNSPLAMVRVNLGDDGTLLGKPKLTVVLDGPNGYHGEVRDHQLDTLLPGDTIAYPLPWPDQLQPGDYTITATLTGADGSAPATHSAQYHLGSALRANNPNAPAAPAPAVPAPHSNGLSLPPVPVLAGALGALVLLNGGGLVVVRIRRNRRAQHSRRRTVPQGNWDNWTLRR